MEMVQPCWLIEHNSRKFPSGLFVLTVYFSPVQVVLSQVIPSNLSNGRLGIETGEQTLQHQMPRLLPPPF